MSVDVEEVEGGLVRVMMNWPEKRNALGPRDTLEVGQAITEASNRALVGVILSGHGAFCAGGDLEQFATLSASTSVAEVRDKIYRNVHAVIRAIRASPVPVVAAVDGPAIGLGFDYALACDMCFVGDHGWLLQGWATAGLIHGAGGSAFVQRASGNQVWRLLAEQPRLDGPTAASLGLAEAVSGQAVAAAETRLRAMGQIRRPVLEAYVELIRDARWPDDAFFDRCADFQAKFIGSAEFREMAKKVLKA